MKGSDSFDEVLEQAISAGLQSELGHEAGVLSVFLDPGIAINKPDSYVSSLGKILPAGTSVDALVAAICQRLYQSLGLQFQVRSDWRLSDYVNDAIGRVESSSGYGEAAKAFRKAAEDYRVAARKIPSLASLFGELASDMDASSLIEEARFYHQDEQYSVAAEKYAKAAEILGTTRARRHLAKHYEACCHLENGEALSHDEKPEATIEEFNAAVERFRAAASELESKLAQNGSGQEKEDTKKWIDITHGREQYSLERVKLEEAKCLDRKGDGEASATKYRSASAGFKALMEETQSEQARKEFETLTLSCEAWADMKEAESRVSPELYAEAAALFTRIEGVTPRKKFRLLALASSSICKALESGTRFRRTRDTKLYSEIKKELETATDYYQAAGLRSAADWARATGKLFDSLVYLTDAATERESRKKTELFHLAKKHLELAARLYGQAGFTVKRDQALQLSQRAREERELLLTPVEALAHSCRSSCSLLSKLLLRIPR